jgi:hypothetical protein
MATSLSRLVPDTDRCLSLRRLPLVLAGVNSVRLQVRKLFAVSVQKREVMGRLIVFLREPLESATLLSQDGEQQNRSPYQFARHTSEFDSAFDFGEIESKEEPSTIPTR